MKFAFALLLIFTIHPLFSQTNFIKKNDSKLDYYSNISGDSNFEHKDKEFSWTNVTGYTSLALIMISAFSFSEVLSNSGSDPDPLYLGTALISGMAACIVGTIGIVLNKMDMASIEKMEFENYNWVIASTDNGVGIVYNF